MSSGASSCESHNSSLFSDLTPLSAWQKSEKSFASASYHLAAEHTCAVIYCGQKLSWLFGKLDFPAKPRPTQGEISFLN
jgi:hypothetical protein